MIPADLAARLRLLNEASFFNTEPPVAGLQRAREIQAQLPELVPGQRFFATLQRALPDGTFRALVAGQQMTLSLNTAAKSGDTLELEVSQVTPRAVFARIVGAEAGAAGNTASAQPALSQTGRLISFLLTGQPTPQPASLAGNQPLLNAPPASGTPLVPLLRQALGQSGLFYESHQAQWVLGKLDTAALLREPQGQQPAPGGNPAASGQPGAGSGASAPGAATPANAAAATPQALAAQGAAALAAGIAGGADDAAQLDSTRSAAALRAGVEEAAPARAQPIPERLMPLVHQQLDALATQQYVWQGQAWPGQPIEWVIEDPQGEGGAEGDDTGPTWNTTLRLTLPRLGGVEAQLHLTAAGVALRLRADDAATIRALDASGAALASALEAANLKLTGLVVEPRHG